MTSLLTKPKQRRQSHRGGGNKCVSQRAAWLIIQNYSYKCLKFYKYVLNEKALLEAARSDKKYKFKLKKKTA